MGENAAVVFGDLTYGYLKVKLSNKLSEIFSHDILEFFRQNYFKFVDHVKSNWIESIDVSELMNSYNPGIKFVYESVSRLKVLIHTQMFHNQQEMINLYFIFTTNLYILLLLVLLELSPLRHTRNNIALFFGKRFTGIVSENNELYLDK